MRNSQFPLILLNLLRLPSFEVGLVMAIAPAVEAVLFLIATLLERRGSVLGGSLSRTAVVGAVLGPVSYALFAISAGSLPLAIGSQVLFGAFVVVNTAVIMSLAVELRLTTAEATVANLLAGEAAGTMAGNVLAVATTATIGLPRAFLAPAGVALVGWLLLGRVIRRSGRSRGFAG